MLCLNSLHSQRFQHMSDDLVECNMLGFNVNFISFSVLRMHRVSHGRASDTNLSSV